MIKIISNGSKWAGQEPDSIETLLEVLGSHPLDRSFEHYGNFKDTHPRWGKYGNLPSPYPEHPNLVTFGGNFFDLSHVFSIHTDDAETIDLLTKAIRANKRRPDYRAQPKPGPDNCNCRRCWKIRPNSAA